MSKNSFQLSAISGQHSAFLNPAWAGAISTLGDLHEWAATKSEWIKLFGWKGLVLLKTNDNR